MNAALQKHVEIFEADRGGVMGVKRAQRFQRRRAAAGIADPLEIGVDVDGFSRLSQDRPERRCSPDGTKRRAAPEGLSSHRKLSINVRLFNNWDGEYDFGEISAGRAQRCGSPD